LPHIGVSVMCTTKDTLGTVFYSSGFILVPRHIVTKTKFA